MSSFYTKESRSHPQAETEERRAKDGRTFAFSEHSAQIEGFFLRRRKLYLIVTIESSRMTANS